MNLLSACSFAPHPQSPAPPLPTHYKETTPWVKTKASLSEQTKQAPWWTLFHDPTLNALENDLNCYNFDIKIALARFQNALAVAQVSRSPLYPSLNLIGTAAQQETSENAANNAPKLRYSTFFLTGFLNYEIDAWGRVRNAAIASNNLATASRYDLNAIVLSMQTQLASDYFRLRGADEAQQALDSTVKAYSKSLYLTRQRHIEGLDPIANVDEATSQLENAKTQATDMRLKRAKLEHAIALLIGRAPANFHLPQQHKTLQTVIVNPEIPSTLLTQRPDIASAMKLVQAANAQIGVARAAFFPQFNLISLLGVQSSELSNLFSSRSLMWSLGPAITLSLVQPALKQVVFDGFRLVGLLKETKANYMATVNSYKKTVLTAFREVEDELVSIHRLKQEQQTQTLATLSARRALQQANYRFQGGLVTYLDVVIYENLALQSELALIDLKTRYQLSSVGLIKALGGGWKAV